jgi:hypothetical protein
MKFTADIGYTINALQLRPVHKQIIFFAPMGIAKKNIDF